MRIVSVLLLGLATNLDNLLVSMAWGAKGRRISPGANVAIAAIVALCSGLVAALGGASVQLGRWPNLVGGALLILMGVVPFFAKPGQSIEGDALRVRPAGKLVTILVLAVILGGNSVVASLSAGMTGVAPLPLALSMAAFSLLTVGLGNLAGQNVLAHLDTRRMEVLANLAMIAVGVWELFL